MKYLISLLALTLLVSTRAEAQPYTRIIPATSSVTFRYSQMGVAMDGRFRKFSAEVRLDPAKPQDTQARVLIDLASIDTGSSEADAEVIVVQRRGTPNRPIRTRKPQADRARSI